MLSTRPTGTDQLRNRCLYEGLFKNYQRPLNNGPTTPNLSPTGTRTLYSGSAFVGTQQSQSHEYNVNVELKYVDLDESYLCGYLTIHGLAEQYPHLTTFFDAEIVGKKYTFLTNNWAADKTVDFDHWVRRSLGNH